MSRRYEHKAYAYDKRGRLLAEASNSYTRTHPLQARLAASVGEPKAIYLHAEVAALLKARGKVYRLVVERRNAHGDPLPSAPCEICRLAIRLAGVKIVEHT